MYQLLTAFLREKGSHHFPVETSVGNVSILDVLTKYDLGHLELSNPAVNGTIYLDLLELRASILPFRNQTVDFWLGTLGNLSLGGSTTPITYEGTKMVRYVEGWSHGISAKRASPYREDALGLTSSESTDVIIEYKDGDYEHVNGNCCFVIGGYGHFSEPSTSGTRVKDGARTMDATSSNLVGILNFSDLGGITQLQINESMVHTEPNISLYNAVIVDTGLDLREKSVLCFIAGFLHGEHDIVKVVNRERGLVRIELHRLDIVMQTLVSMGHLDYSGVDFFSLVHPGNVDVDQIKSDRAIMDILTMVQTFMVIVNQPVYNIDWRLPEQSTFTGRVIYPDTVERVGYPLLDNYGRIVPYTIRKEPYSVVQVYSPLDNKVPALSLDNAYTVTELFNGGDVGDTAFKTVRPLLITA